MHQRVAGFEFQRDDLVAPLGRHLAGGAFGGGDRTGDVAGRVDDQPDARCPPALAHPATEDMHHRGLLGNLVQVFDDARGDVVVAQHLGHPAGLAGAFDAEQHPPAVGHVLFDLSGEGLDVAMPAGNVDQVEMLAGLGVRVGDER